MTLFPPVKKSAWVLKLAFGRKALISLSLSTINRTETDCTRPAESPPLTFFHKTGESS